PRVRRVEGGLTLTEGSEEATRPCAGHAPTQIEKAADEQQRRAEAEQQRQEWRSSRAGRRRADRDIVLLEQRFEVVRREGRSLGLEERAAGGPGGHRFLEVTLDGVGLRGAVIDVVGIHLLVAGGVGQRDVVWAA